MDRDHDHLLNSVVNCLFIRETDPVTGTVTRRLYLEEGIPQKYQIMEVESHTRRIFDSYPEIGILDWYLGETFITFARDFTISRTNKVDEQ